MALPAWLEVLDDDDLQFLKRFVLSSGSLKDLAASYEVSYPTLRIRLDRLIAKVQAGDDQKLTDPFERKLKLLIADGQITASLARDLLNTHRTVQSGRK